MSLWRRNGNRKCPRCRARSFVYKCSVCGKKRCTSCGEWFYFYVLRRGNKSSVVKTKAFCSRGCEERFLEPYVSRFLEEHKGKANSLLKHNRRAVEEWFSSQIGYPKYDVWSEQYERFFKRPQFEEALEKVLSGKTRVVEFETLQEAIDLKTALLGHCTSSKAWLEHIQITSEGDLLKRALGELFPSDHDPDQYLVFVDDDWRNEGIEPA